MNIAQILKAKGRAVATVRPDASLFEIINKLAQKRIGAIVVVGDNGEVVGIISERDIIRAISAQGPSVLNDPVARYMTARVVTVQENTPVIAVMDMMTKGRFRHVPVVDGDACVAVISIVDIVKQRVRDIEFEHEALHSYIAGSN